MWGTVRTTLLTVLAAVPLGAAAGAEPPANCAQQSATGPCVVWSAADASRADANPATASFDRLSSPRSADAPALATTVLAAELDTVPARSVESAVSTLDVHATQGLRFKGIPLGLWFTALVVVAYALRRCERVWPQKASTDGAVKHPYLTTEAGRL